MATAPLFEFGIDHAAGDLLSDAGQDIAQRTHLSGFVRLARTVMGAAALRKGRRGTQQSEGDQTNKKTSAHRGLVRHRS